jgi:hypothetical protein
LPDGTVFAVGKTNIGFHLHQSDLTPVGPLAGRICGGDPDGGPAYDPALESLYVPCRDGGLQQVLMGSGHTGWRSGQVNSTPVLAGGGLWAVAYPEGVLQELDPATGKVILSQDVGRAVTHFASPAVAAGIILVPTLSGLVAFTGPARH